MLKPTIAIPTVPKVFGMLENTQNVWLKIANRVNKKPTHEQMPEAIVPTFLPFKLERDEKISKPRA